MSPGNKGRKPFGKGQREPLSKFLQDEMMMSRRSRRRCDGFSVTIWQWPDWESRPMRKECTANSDRGQLPQSRTQITSNTTPDKHTPEIHARRRPDQQVEALSTDFDNRSWASEEKTILLNHPLRSLPKAPQASHQRTEVFPDFSSVQRQTRPVNRTLR